MYVEKKGIKSHGLKLLSVTLANCGTPVMGNYGKIKKLQIVFTIHDTIRRLLVIDQRGNS